jgi:hypothetical protein
MNPTGAYLAEIARLYLLLVLAAAAIGKLLTFAEFRESAAELFGLAPRLAAAGALLVVAAEATAALLLAAGGTAARSGAAAALLLLLAFTAAILQALFHGRAVRCNCFGGFGRPVSAWDVARNFLLVAACLLCLRGSALAVPVPVAAWVVMGGVALVLALVSIHLEALAEAAG